jgi:curved DNA-binding protein CbpA
MNQNNDPKGYYATLEIPKDATSGQIKKAYKMLAMKWHPDKNPQNIDYASEKFKKIAEAYDTLGNEEKRRNYDSGNIFNSSFQNDASPNFQGFHHFNSDHNESIRRAFEMFNTFFARQNDPFNTNRFSTSHMNHFGNDFFNDPFFDSVSNLSNIRNTPGVNHFSFSSSSGGTGNGNYRSVSTTTTTTVGEDGKKITRKETTITHPDGRVETTVEENNDTNNIQFRIR